MMNDTVVICWKDSQHLVKQFRCVDPLESWKSIRSKSVQTLYNLYSPVLPVLRWEKELILSNDLFMTTFAKILNEGKRILRTGGSVVFPAETSWGKNIQHLRSLPFAKPYTISFTHSFPFPSPLPSPSPTQKHYFVFSLKTKPKKNLTRKKYDTK